MTTPILKSKLFIPPSRAELVSRPRLFSLLNPGIGHKLVLICAPAGFGKSTLLSEWVRGQTEDVAWISLGSSENASLPFLAYFLSALQLVLPDLNPFILSMITAPQPPAVEQILIEIVNEMHRLPDPSIIVLDDYQFIQNDEVHELVNFIIEHQPDRSHIVIATREDPPLRLARWRARKQLTEIRANDLRFTLEESGELLNQQLELDLSEGELSQLHAETEGWAAGLQLAALSLREHPDRAAFIQEFSGKDRFVMDYLMDEVLQGLPAEIQLFLLRTAFLDRFCGSLCDALRADLDQQTPSQQILESLEQTNLFIIPLDNQREWYRYHHLFAELLQHRSRRLADLDPIADHLRAAEWCYAHGFVAEAVEYALRRDQVDRAVRFIEGNVFQYMVRGNIPEILNALKRLPQEVVQSSPWLQTAQAWVMAYSGQYQTADQRLSDIDEELRPLSLPDLALLRGTVYTIHSHVCAALAQNQRSINFARRALDLLPEENLTMRSLATLMAAVGLSEHGDWEILFQQIEQAVALGRAADDTNAVMIALCDKIRYQMLIGDFPSAIDTCRRALETAEAGENKQNQRVPLKSYASSLMASLLNEQGALDEALDFALRGVDLSKLWGQTQVQYNAYRVLFNIYLDQGQFEAAAETLHRMEQFTQTRSVTQAWYEKDLILLNVLIYRYQGQWKRALGLFEESGVTKSDEINTRNHNLYLTLARVLMECGQIQSVDGLLRRIRAGAERLGLGWILIQTEILQAILAQRTQQHAAAQQLIRSALKIGAPNNMVQVFIREADSLAPLLYEALDEGIEPVFTHTLLVRMLEDTQPDQIEGNLPAGVYFEMLSERELEVLMEIARGATNQEIAAALVISLSTVKTHISHIYTKLDVKNRTEAVLRASALGLLRRE